MVEECALADASSKHFTPTRYGAATFVNFCHLTTRHTYVVMAIVCASSRHALTPRVCVYVAAYLGYTDQLFVALNAGSDSARALDRSSWLLGLLNFSVMRYVFTDKMDSVAHSLRRLLTIDMIPQVSICVFRQWDPPPPFPHGHMSALTRCLASASFAMRTGRPTRIARPQRVSVQRAIQAGYC